MTAIATLLTQAKEGPAAQPLLPAAADTSHPATSFAKLLEDADNKPKAAPAHRAYSFAELGMFGLHATQFSSTPEPAAKSQGSGKVLIEPAADKTREKNKSAGTTPIIYVTSLDVAASPMPSHAAAASAGSVTTAKTQAPAATPVAARNAAASDAKVPAPQRSAASTAAKLSEAAAARKTVDPVSVTVAGPDDALQIAVRSAPASEIVNLRRLVRTTVAQFEMAVAELHVNGMAGEDPTFSMMGGADGGRSG